MKAQPPLQIYKSTNAILILGREIQAAHHSHHALQVSVSLDQPFRLEWNSTDQGNSGDNQVQKELFDGAIVAPDFSHRLDGRSGRQALLLIDPEHAWAKQLTQLWLGQSTVAPLPASVVEPLRQRLALPHGAANPIDSLLNELLPEGVGLATLDPRIFTALDYLQLQTPKTVSARELAAQVHLSESRLGHLFKQQVGIPVRRYLMWLRLMDAIEYAFDGHTLTAAAAYAGFADSAHFSRTFQAMFGISASAVIQHSQFIQVPGTRSPL